MIICGDPKRKQLKEEEKKRKDAGKSGSSIKLRLLNPELGHSVISLEW